MRFLLDNLATLAKLRVLKDFKPRSVTLGIIIRIIDD